MGKYASEVVKQAKAWLGRKESNGSHKYIIDVYNSHRPLARGYAVKYSDEWCATFVSAVAVKLGYTDIIPTECGCEPMINLFKKMGCWKESDSRKPNPGDIIFYDWDDTGYGDTKGWSDHVGIVEKVSGNTITVIEGNMHEKVDRRNISVNGRYIRGYGVPNYDTKSSSTEKTETPKKETTAQKNITTIAKEVIAGKWGNGDARKNALEKAGYNYNKVQEKVEELLEGSKPKTNTTVKAKSITATKKASSFSEKIAGTYKTTDDLRMRNGASTDDKILVVLPNNTKVNCYGYYSVDKSKDKWYYVQATVKGVKYTGFCHSDYLKK